MFRVQELFQQTNLYKIPQTTKKNEPILSARWKK